MNKFLKLLPRLSCGLVAGLLTGTMAAEVVAQPKPPAVTAPATNSLSYSFFQGLTFAPFPGTIPRSLINGSLEGSPRFPLVEVPTPGLIADKRSGTTTSPVINKKKKLVEPPVKRRRRVIQRNKQT